MRQSTRAAMIEPCSPTRKPLLWFWAESAERARDVMELLSSLPSIDLRLLRSPEELLARPDEDQTMVLLYARASPLVLHTIRRLKTSSACVFCLVDHDGQSGLETSCQVLLAGAAHVLHLHSPLFLSELAARVQQADEQARSSQVERDELNFIMLKTGFIGRSEFVLSLFRSIRSVSQLTDLPVLITGETGTGKELVARAIHSLDSKRRSRRLVSINCAALPQELSESELFGHQRGAFTGAERERSGLFRAADGGMLFLDEVGELSPGLQGKLLRVLQTNQLRSVGADHEVEIDVRVVAATNRRLDEMVQTGSFREDLFHRLNVLTLHIRPLRERPADIAPLIDHFVGKHHSVWRTTARPQVAPDFVEALEKAMLPGNTRQLENMVCRALVQSEGNVPLSLKDLPPEIWQELSRAHSLVSCSEHDHTAQEPVLEEQAIHYLRKHDWNLLQTMRFVESVLVRGAVDASGGNQSQAARLLGITPRSVYNKLHRPTGS